MALIDQIPLPDDAVISKFIDGEMVLLHPTQGKVRVLNSVGARVWELSDGSRSIRQIIGEIAKEYTVDVGTAETDIVLFLQNIHEAGLITFINR